MKANVDKTKSKDYYQEIFILVITGLLLRYNVFKFLNYLGIDISWTRSVRVCKKFLSENAIKAMYEIMKREENIIFLLAVNFFDKLIKKTYCEIWGYGNNDILEKVHLEFCQIILHLKA